MTTKKIFIFLILHFIFSGSFAQDSSYVFHQLSIKDGLSEGTVRAIIKDKRGFMWFGTEDGLNKYDGYKFNVYKTDISDSFSISSNNTKCFYNAPNGDLWIGTRHGVNIYDHLSERFYNFRSDKFPVLKYITGDIESIINDESGGIWVLTSSHGLYKVTSLDQSPKQFLYPVYEGNNQFVSITLDKDNNFLLGSHNGLLKFNTHTNHFEDLRKLYGKGYQVRAIHIDEENVIWLATMEGLKRIDQKSGMLKEYKHDPFVKNSILGNNTVRFLAKKNKLLIAVDGSGIDLFDTKTEIFSHITKESGSQLNSNNITALYQDPKGTLWAGTFLNGINFTNSGTNLFVSIRNNSNPTESVHSGVVSSFLKDSKGNFWISTDGGGLNYKKKGSDKFVNYDGVYSKSIIASPSALGLFESKDGDIWVSTYAGGVSKISPNGKATIFRHDPTDSTSLCWDKTKAICEYQNQIWISSHGMGLSVYNKFTNKFKHYKHNPANAGTLPSDWVYYILKDNQNTLWFATFKGLTKYIPKEDKFKTYKLNLNGNNVDKDYIFDIVEDSQGNLWLGTNGGGLVQFDRKTEILTTYNTNNGLSDNAVKSIIEDKNGNLWLATNNGITKFNINTRKSVSFKINDGLPAGSFFYNSKFLDSQGKVYFGMNDGYLVIDPLLSVMEVDHPEVVLTGFMLFNSPITPRSQSSPLKINISEAKEISLDHNQNSISFEFAALNFTIPRHNYYAYYLEGFDKSWNYSGKERIAKYTNLDPGQYIFKVKASNNEKILGSKLTSFVIIISPPFWDTLWFKILIILSLVSIFGGYFYFRVRNIRQRNKWLAEQVEIRTFELMEVNRMLEMEKDNVLEQSSKILVQQQELLEKKYELEKSNEQLTEWGQFQNKLIGILGHDIRGPLQNFSLLLQLQDQQSGEWIKKTLKETADSLSMLATDLLSWASLQSQQGAVEYVNFQWMDVIEKAQKQLKANYEGKHLTFLITEGIESKVKGVPPMVLACIRNILSNSIRYSEIGGVIEIETGQNHKGLAYLRITDFGKGFDAEKVNKMIHGDAFSGVKDSSLKESAGLGMAICHDMIKRTGGHVEAASLPGSGATFFIYLPLANTLIDDFSEADLKETTEVLSYKIEKLSGRTILLVEDDDQLRINTAKLLGQYVEIKEVQNAEEALTWLEENTPDMAILDVFMKGLSGIDLCRQIKDSEKTSHVACTIISGDMSEETRTKAFLSGADAFIAKPFNTNDLLTYVAEYFENQSSIMHRFFQEDLAISCITQNPLNQRFLSSVLEHVTDNLSSVHLNVDFLAQNTGLSRSSFNRKMRSLTGLSANDFILNARMRKAVMLLSDKKLNISDVAAKTGFLNSSFFISAFKKHFGYNPNDLHKNPLVV